MNSKKAKILYAKLLILILCMLIVVRLFTLVLSKYESISNSDAKIDIAFYLFKEDYKVMTTKLPTLYPKDGVYVYTFSVGNEEGTQRAETDLIYDIKIRTTTNLPLTFDLYMNQNYNDKGAKSIIKTNEIVKDAQGTYFRTITVDPVLMEYTKGTTNVYQITVNFPKTYNQEKYQDIIEMLEITVDAKQVTENA